MESILGQLKEEATLLSNYRAQDILDQVRRIRSQGRIRLLRTGVAFPKNSIEQEYLKALGNYVSLKLRERKMSLRHDYSTPGAKEMIEEARTQMTYLEMEMLVTEHYPNIGYGADLNG